VTQVGYSESSGEILGGDIYINDGYTFSTNSLDSNYLGNVITHEVGHFLGLSHGQVLGSTMFYSLTYGQHTVSDDDKAGVYSIYPTNNSSLGSISGTIIGGKNLVKVFGSHVQATSVKTGKVMGAVISGVDGSFTINGLPRDDQYLIYTSPIKLINSLPTNYSNVRSDFCDSSQKYRGSFFQSCWQSSSGFPQAVSLTSSSKNVGSVSIRCGLDSPAEYLQNKNTTPAVFDLNTYTQSGLGGSFVGFFSAAEIQQNLAIDYFKLDLTNVDWASISSSNSLFLELKVTNQPFYSLFKARINVKYGSSNYDVVPDYVQQSDGEFNIDTIERVAINRAIPSDNLFEIKVTPEVTGFPTFPSGIPFTKDELFPSYSDLKDDLYFYLVTTTIVKDNGDGTYSQVATKNETPTDNRQCPDAVNTYAISSYGATGSSSGSSRVQSPLACGSVVMESGENSGGPGGFMVGLLLSLIISYLITRYSKMA